MIHAILLLLAFDAVPTPRFSPRAPSPVFAQRVPRPIFSTRIERKQADDSSGTVPHAEQQGGTNKEGGDTAAHDATAAPSPASPGTRVILWSATWCGPCQALRPSVARLQAAGWPIEIHDCDTERETFAGWGLRVVPTLQVIASDGRELSRITPGSAEQIVAELQRCGVRQE